MPPPHPPTIPAAARLRSASNPAAPRHIPPSAHGKHASPTRRFATTDALVNRALELIATNAFDPDFHTEFLLRELKCSRSLLEMRFRAIQGHSIRDEIQMLRFDKALSLLRRPNQAIAPIANLCGYASEPFFKRLFKKKTGLTMREWRKKNMTQRA